MKHYSIVMSVMNAAIKAVMLFGVLSGSVEGPGDAESRGLVARGDGSVIEDPNRAMALFQWTEKLKPRDQKLPQALHRIIGEYSDFNEIKEIKTLFQMLPLAEDRMGVLGFEIYEDFDAEYPCIADKVSYLKSLYRGNRMLTEEDGASDENVYDLLFDGHSIVSIDWRAYRKMCTDNPQEIDWSVIKQLHNLQSLTLHGLELEISMSDLAQLPSSLRFLQISGNNWEEPSGDVDLGKLPSGLTELVAHCCAGMTGFVGLHAPQSKLEEVYLDRNYLKGICNITETPPQLNLLNLAYNDMFKVAEVPANIRQRLEDQYNCSLEHLLGMEMR